MNLFINAGVIIIARIEFGLNLNNPFKLILTTSCSSRIDTQKLKGDSMISNDPLEINSLNKQWLSYVKSYRLKHLFVFPSEVIDFICNLNFISCENNSDQIIPYTFIYYCDNGMSDLIPQYKHKIRVKQNFYELSRFVSFNTWHIDSLQLKDFFQIRTEQEKILCDLFDGFKLYDRLGNIRMENRLARYKKRFKTSINISDIIIKDKEYYFILEDGTQAKIVHVPEG